MNFSTALRTAASNYSRGTTADYSNTAADKIAANTATADIAHTVTATDTDIWTTAMNALLFIQMTDDASTAAF
jgi:galactitol-specific phosphotransferase system IIB component